MDILIEERRGTYQAPTVRPGMTAGYFRRVSWQAIWAGAISAMALLFLCGLMGMGAAPDSPTLLLGGQFPLAGIPVWLGLWYLLYTAVVSYVGAKISVLSAGVSGVNGILHGYLSWAFTTMLGFFAMTSFAARNAGMFAGTSSLTPISTGWMFWGLLFGAVAATAGGWPADYFLEEELRGSAKEHRSNMRRDTL